MASIGDVFAVKTITRFVPAVGNAANGLNITHWQVSSQTGTGASNNAIALSFSIIFASNYKPLMSTLATFQGVICQRILPLPILLPFGSTGDAGPGTVAGEPLPPQTAGLITKREVGVGRKKRGRLYIPWPVEVDNDVDGRPTLGYITRLNTLGGIMSAAVLAGVVPDTTTLIPVLFHPKPVPGTVTPISSAVGRSYWGVQRRRSTAFNADTPVVFPIP